MINIIPHCVCFVSSGRTGKNEKLVDYFSSELKEKVFSFLPECASLDSYSHGNRESPITDSLTEIVLFSPSGAKYYLASSFPGEDMDLQKQSGS